MESGAEAVDIRLGRCLRFAILFGSGVTSRAKGNGIFHFPRLELVRNAKIDQVHVVVVGSHNIWSLHNNRYDTRTPESPAQHMRGKGSPTNISNTRIPPISVRKKTIPAGSA